MKAAQIARAKVAFNVNVNNLKSNLTKTLYTTTFNRLLNDFTNDLITLEELASKAKERYTDLIAKYHTA